MKYSSLYNSFIDSCQNHRIREQFAEINEIKNSLKAVKIENLDNITDCKLLLNKAELARELAKLLKEDIEKLGGLSSTTSKAHDVLSDMMQAITVKASEIKDRIVIIEAQNTVKSAPTLEQIVMPSISSYIAIVASGLRHEMSKQGASEEKIDDFLRKNAIILAQELYKEESTSLLSRKYSSMSDHYFQVLKQNADLASLTQKIEKLTVDNQTLKSENQKLKSQIKPTREAVDLSFISASSSKAKDNNSLRFYDSTVISSYDSSDDESEILRPKRGFRRKS